MLSEEERFQLSDDAFDDNGDSEGGDDPKKMEVNHI